MHPIDWITGSIMDSAMGIHSALGAGLFESVYEGVDNRLDEDPHRMVAARI
jgi:hypothetical protein